MAHFVEGVACTDEPRAAPCTTAMLTGYRRAPILLLATVVTGNAPSRPICGRTPSELQERLWNEEVYDASTRPEVALAIRGVPPPVIPVEEVQAQLQIFSIVDVDTAERHLTLDAWMRTIWFDRRLLFNASCLVDRAADTYAEFSGSPASAGVWSPELYQENMIDSEKTITSAWWLRGDGQVWWTRKAIWKLRCPMTFGDMPFDVQTCVARVSSMKFNDAKISIIFADPAVRVTCGDVGGTVEWRLVSGYGSRPGADADGHVDGTGSIIDFNIKIQRRSHYYVDNVVVFATSLVVVAYLSFYVSRYAPPARVGTTFACLLALSNKEQTVLRLLPQVSYSVWLLDYMRGAFMFVLYAMAEYAIANYLMRVEKRVQEARKLAMAQRGTRHPAKSTEEQRARELREGLQAGDAMPAKSAPRQHHAVPPSPPASPPLAPRVGMRPTAQLAPSSAASAQAPVLAAPDASPPKTRRQSSPVVATVATAAAVARAKDVAVEFASHEGEVVQQYVKSWLRRASLPPSSDDVRLTRPEVVMHLFLIERLFVNRAGELWLRDQHLDGFSRSAFPLAFAVFAGIMAARVPEHTFHDGVVCPGV